jgi:pseudouridine-5'-phosphate glycosidase
VALESTLITHGLPYPDNARTALAAEETVRASGAVPATIAIVHGRVRVGLSPEEIRDLASDKSAGKASRRDIPAVLVKGRSAGTTVAATMFIAARAHIAVFATGGIGGVHRGAETTFDISADLTELGSTPIAVVAAGAKSILDIPKTLEVLETLGVPVLGYGSDDFPAFFARASGCKVEHRFDRIEDIARVIASHRALGLPCGILITNPIPEAQALAPELIDDRIEMAVAEAQSKGVAGKDLTPYLLGRLAELSDGRSLAANMALIGNNAALAGRIAVAVAALARASAGSSIYPGSEEGYSP